MEKKNFFAPWSKGLGATRRAAMLLLTLIFAFAGAQTAWAATVTTHITYDGVAASDVTVSATYTGQAGQSQSTLSNGSKFYPVDNTVVTVAVTSSQSISTEFSATYLYFGYQEKPLTVSTNGNNCTFTPDPDYETTLNITVRPGGVQAYYVHYSTGDEFGVSGSMADQTFYVGVAQNLSPCGFTRDGYTFAGWATTPNGSVVYSDGQEVTDIAEAGQTITLYAKWTKNSSGGDDPFNPGGDNPFNPGGDDPSNPGGDDPLPANTYRVRFDGNQANCVGRVSGSMDDQMFTVGVAQALAANEFTNDLQGLSPYCGWNTKADGSGTAYADGQVVTDIAAEGQTITLYAQWGEFEVSSPYAYVYFNANGGTGTMTKQQFHKGIYENLTPCTFTRSGYNFTGWNTKADGSGDSYDDQQEIRLTKDITLYAQWEKEADLAVNGNTYTINTAEGWNVFCDCLDDNDTYNRFSGKTVKLGNDIGTAQDPITRMAGSSKHDFCGTFDGDGHTLTVNISSDDITDGSTQYVAPFRYVSTTKADPNDQADSPAAIRNLHVTGTITTDKQFTGGLIGGCWGTVSIDNCAVSVTIQSTISDDGTHGGIVGIQQSGALTITGCLFDGSLLGATTYAVGGFLGYRKSGAEISNSLFAPAEVTVLNTSGATFARNKVDTYNSYYTYYLCDGTNYKPYLDDGTVSPAKWNNGKAAHRITAGENVTIDGLGAGTEYSVSGITAYPTGIKYNDVYYAGSGDEVSLTLSNSSGDAPAGYQYGYSASAGTLSGTENPYTLTMPDEDVTITVGLSVIDWATESDGDADHPYMIYNKDQLDLLAQRVNGGTVAYDKVIEDDGAHFYYYYSDKYFKLMNDITYSHTTDWFSNYNSTENNYEAIGCYYSYDNYRVFNGHFDGNGKTIRGIRIYKDGSDDDVDSCQGIFGITNSDAYIHDLTLADACITGYLSTGGIVGANVGGTITRCHVANNVAINSVKDASGHGGIVGYNNGGTVSHCTSAVKLYHENNSDYFLGGIAGANDGTLKDNLVIGATIPNNNNKAYGAITGGHESGTLEHNYYTACIVAGVSNTTGVGRCLNEHGTKFTIADATENDGAVPALRDGADNTYALSLFAAIPATLDLGWGAGKYSVQLTGRTLYKDGEWNTLCLPFDVSTTSGPLAGDDVVAMTLNTSESNLTGSKLTLNFDAAETIPAGTPFIIKWGEQEGKTGYLGTIIENPVFTGVTIDNTMNNADFTGGTFKGTYSPIVWDTENKSILFVGTNNTLYWPTAGGHVNACRAYFDLGSASAREFVMNFEEGNDETTSLPLPLQKEGSQADAWYTLDGRKLNGKPTTKGLYIHNGKKVIIK